MTLWDFKAILYVLFRSIPPFRNILNRERSLLRNLYDKLDVGQGRVLDVGTGTGDNLAGLVLNGRTYAVDNSGTMLGIVRRHFPSVSCVRADAFALPFRRDSFRVVTCIGLMEYYEDPRLLLDSLSCCLAPGGIALVSTSPRNAFARLRNLLGHRVYVREPVHVLSAAQDVGFEVVEQRRCGTQEVYMLSRVFKTIDLDNNGVSLTGSIVNV